MRPFRVFVIQPYGAKHSDTFFNNIHEACVSTKGDFIAFRADKESTKAGPRLQDRIDSYIRCSDICVADLSGARNDNALLEVGAAYTLGIPVIPVSDKQLPSDITGNFYISLDPNSMDKEQTNQKFRNDLISRLLEVRSGLPVYDRSHQFIAQGFASRRIVDFYSLVTRCEERIDILTTNLGFIVNTELPCGMEKRALSFLDMVAEEIPKKQRSFSMRILALDPDSNFTNERALALDRDRREFREHMREDLTTLKEFVESSECPAAVQIKIYDAFPLQMTYFFDDVVVSSVVAYGRSSRDCITYIHSLNEIGAKETYEKHFDKMWNSGRLYAQGSKPNPRRRHWKKALTSAEPEGCMR